MRAACRFGLLLLAILCCAALVAPGAGAADDQPASSGGPPPEPWKEAPWSQFLVHVARGGMVIWRGTLPGLAGGQRRLVGVSGDGSLWITMGDDLVHLAADGREAWRGTGFGASGVIVPDPQDGSCWVDAGQGGFVHLSAEGKELGREKELDPSILPAAGRAANPRNGSRWEASYHWPPGLPEDGPHVGALAITRVAHFAADGSEMGATERLDWGATLHASPFDDSCWAVSGGGVLYHISADCQDVERVLPSHCMTGGELAVNSSDGSCWTFCGIFGADLCEAAARGDTDVVRAALAAKMPADVRDDRYGRTPLHRAAEGGHTEVIRLLLAAGADVDAEDRYVGDTPLHLAARGGHTDVIQLLLDAGAEVDAEDREYGSRPLYYAISGGHAPAAKLLLERGAAVDTINHTRDPVSIGSTEDFTALSKASEMGRTDLVVLLLDAGADATGHGNGGWPLFLAMSRGHVEVMRLLLDHGAGVNAKGRDGSTLLHSTGKPEWVRFLLARGADKDARDEGGRTPLHVAAVMAWLEAAQLLLDAGADVNARDREGWTPLHYAALASRKAKYFSLDLTKMLLRYGADHGARDRDGNTPLHLGASGKTGLAGAALLLEARPDLGVRNNEGDTLLHTAAALGCTEWAFVLLDKGADPRARNAHDETPLHLAAQNDLCDLAERLLDLGAGIDDTNADGDTALHLAAKGRAWTRYEDAAAPTLYRNVQPGGNQTTQPIQLHDSDLRTVGDSVLQRYYGWPTDRPPGATTKCLLRRGADPNARNKAGSTALRCALTVALSDTRYSGVTPRTANTLSALVAGGADPNAADADGDTPVHLAAQGLPDALQQLLERGGRVDARDQRGNTPLHAAAAATAQTDARGCGYDPGAAKRLAEDIAQCVRLLVEHGADVGALNSGGDSPLHTAVTVGGVRPVVEALLDGHAAISEFNGHGKTPLQLAIAETGERDAILQLLRDRGAE